jgi:hypothetical protein
MQIVPKPGATTPTSTSTPAQTSAQSAKERAISALMGGQNSQHSQQLNQNNISPEEASVVKTAEPTGQTDIVEEQQADTTSAPQEEVTTPKEEEPLSSQHAILARKEKAFRAKVVAQEQSLKAKEAALAAREAELTSKSTQDLANYISKDKLLRDPIRMLNELGITYDKLSEQALASQSPEAQYMQQMRAELDEELRKVREEQANTRKSYEQQQAEAYQQAVNQIRNEATQLVNADPSFETIKETGSVNDVVELIERTFKEEGTLLTVQQAAEAIEDFLIEEALKITKIKKIQSRLNPAPTPVAKSPAPSAPKSEPEAQSMKTLTNSVTNTRPLSPRERAILAMTGKLNK